MKSFLVIVVSVFMLWGAVAYAQPGSAFLVTIDNIAGDYTYYSSGVFNQPMSYGNAGPILPGQAFRFSFTAPAGSYLSFATMFGQSNDAFYAPGEAGIALYAGNGDPIVGDITGQLMLWDAGTEANQEPGVGTDQAPRQPVPDTGAADPDTAVRLVSDGYTYPDVADVIRATLYYAGGDMFEVSVENVSTDTTLGGLYSVPLSPGAWAVHTGSNPLFTPGSPDTKGLEHLAEDGNPADLNTSMDSEAGVQSHGLFNMPISIEEPGPVMSDQSFEFTFEATEGTYLSFATMFGQSNDGFYAPEETGIQLYDDMGDPVAGDLTGMLHLWDAGTEANQEPGVGSTQAPRQSAPDTGPADPDSLMRLLSDGYAYPDVEEVIKATLLYAGEDTFKVRIENESTDTTILDLYSVPLSPGVWVVHSNPGVLFTPGQPDMKMGLEHLAEDGNPAMLGEALINATGIPVALSPGVFAVHNAADPFFTAGERDRSIGLELLAEDGNPLVLAAMIPGKPGIVKSGTFTTSDGEAPTGPLAPGQTFQFYFLANPGEMLSFVSMFGQSNDVFFAPDGDGIPLFDDNDQQLSGDVTSYIHLWDAGTERNQIPGYGSDQAPRQPAPNTGPFDIDNSVRLVSDGFTYPDVAASIRVTLTPVHLTGFDIHIENVSTSTTLSPSDESTQQIPLSPGVWAVHTLPDPIFSVGKADRGQGLERLAEDGNPETLGGKLARVSGVFQDGVFDTGVDSNDPGPILPGGAFDFTVYAFPGSNLTFATMFGQSNDLFYAPANTGIPLFDENDQPVEDDVTNLVILWDAGTEENQEPGVGVDQAPRQSAPDTGADDPDDYVRLVSDGYTYPAVYDVIQVTIAPVPEVVSVDSDQDAVPAAVSLDQNFPNPFNPTTTINFSLPGREHVELIIYNQLGQAIRKLVDTDMPAGSYSTVWNGLDDGGRSAASGLYLYRIKAGDTVLTRRMLLLR